MSDLPHTNGATSHDAIINIGDQYQCTHLPSPTKVNLSASPSAILVDEGTLQYSYNTYCSTYTSNTSSLDKHLDGYLAHVHRLFNTEPHHYNEQAALHLLHACDYDIRLAKQLLKPAKPSDLDTTDTATNVINLTADDICCVCTDGGDMILCDDPQCKKVYHPGCVELERIPEGSWRCTYHQCTVCHTPTYTKQYYCTFCPTSYCADHVPTDLIARLQAVGIHEFCCTTCADKNIAHYHRDQLKNTPKRSFIKRLLSLLKREGKRLLKIPRVNHTELDLYAFYIAVIQRGGITPVHRDNAMLDVAKQIKLAHKSDTAYNDALITMLLQHYMNILYLYEKIYYSGWVECNDTLDRLRLQYDRDDDGNLILDDVQMKHALSNPVHSSAVRDDAPNSVVAAFVPRPRIKRIKTNGQLTDATVAVTAPSKPLTHSHTLVDDRSRGGDSGNRRRGSQVGGGAANRGSQRGGMLANAGRRKSMAGGVVKTPSTAGGSNMQGRADRVEQRRSKGDTGVKIDGSAL